MPARHPLCPVPVANIARVGVLAFLTLGVGCTKRDAGGRQQPLPADLPRPKLLWSVSGLGILGGGQVPFDPTGTVFLFDANRHAPFAVSAKTGRRLWTAEVDPTVPVAPPSPSGARYFQLSLADEVLVLGTPGYVAAYRTDDGKRLWSRPEPDCNVLETRGRHLRLFGRKNGGFTDRIVKAATGEEVAVVEPAPDKRATNSRSSSAVWPEVTLGRDVLLIAWDNGTNIEGRPLRAGLPSWRVELPPKSIDDDRPWVRVLFVDGVFICFGGPMIALDESTGRRLWERPLSHKHQETAAGNMLVLMERNEVVKLDARSGAVRGRYAVPSLPDRRAAYHLLAAGHRVALVEGDVTEEWSGSMLETEEGYVVTWTAGARAPVILIRPARTDVFAMVGDVLLAAGSDDGQLFAADLRDAVPPPAKLPPQADGGRRAEPAQ